MKILDDMFMICDDCVQAAIYDEYSGLDYHYNEVEADLRVEQIQRGLENCGGYITLGDSEEDIEFSEWPCNCCGIKFAGKRYHCVVLGDEDENEK